MSLEKNLLLFPVLGCQSPSEQPQGAQTQLTTYQMPSLSSSDVLTFQGGDVLVKGPRPLSGYSSSHMGDEKGYTDGSWEFSSTNFFERLHHRFLLRSYYLSCISLKSSYFDPHLSISSLWCPECSLTHLQLFCIYYFYLHPHNSLCLTLCDSHSTKHPRFWLWVHLTLIEKTPSLPWQVLYRIKRKLFISDILHWYEF